MVEEENNKDWLTEVVSKFTLRESERINRQAQDLLDEIGIFKARLQGEEIKPEIETTE